LKRCVWKPLPQDLFGKGCERLAESMNVCVIGGAGYVGLVTSLGLSEIGHHVIAVDLNQDRIRQLQAGECPIYEAGMQQLLDRNLREGRIRFSTDLSEAVFSSEVVFIAVGTPSHEDGQVDLSQVVRVTEGLEKFLDGYKLIVIKSTVPMGTVELIQSKLNGRHAAEDLDIVINPEFLREGHGLRDFFYPDRVVIGSDSTRARTIMRQLYEPIIQGTVSWTDGVREANLSHPIPVVETDPASAQMIKYASNAFLAARISMINEIAGLCEVVGSDINEVVRGIGYDPRIGSTYLNAGLGFGGPCLEKDLRALMTIGESNSYHPNLLRAVLDRNVQQVEQVVAKLEHLVGGLLTGKTLAVLGLAFKSGTDDVRNSLALKVIDRLQREGATIRSHDPLARPVYPEFTCYEDPYQASSVTPGWSSPIL